MATDAPSDDIEIGVGGDHIHLDTIDAEQFTELTAAFVHAMVAQADGDLALRGIRLVEGSAVAAIHQSSTPTAALALREIENGLAGPRQAPAHIRRLRGALAKIDAGCPVWARVGALRSDFRALAAPETAWSRETVTLRVSPFKIGGLRRDRVSLVSLSEKWPFTIDIDRAKSEQLAVHLHHPVDAELLMVRDDLGRIRKGRLIDFEPLATGDSRDFWQRILTDELPQWRDLTDVTSALERGNGH